MNKYLIIIIMFSLILSGCNNNTNNNIYEEATPVRDKDKIVGIDYKININSKEDNITINTKIIDSINHYKDINNIDDFYINLMINNTSNCKYYLKKIEINNSDSCLKKYNYNISISKKEKVFLLLDKNIIDRIKNSVSNSKIVLYIEKK